MNGDPGIICYQHRKNESKVFSFVFSDVCKICEADLTEEELFIPPFRIPYPFRCACREPNAIVIKPTEGDFLNNYANSSNLHIGITDSKGNVYEYDYSGISQNNGDSWSQCFPIKIFNSKSSCLPSEWDKTLDNMQMQKCWSAERYNEESYNCYSFVLSFLKALDLQELHPYIQNKTTFCEYFVAPQTCIAAKYISLYRQLQNEGYIVQ
ncbi:MKRN2 opposite strand protein-like isoform X2 [Uloborus diversus]|uniref:MKRN2 opposite strand protein-like isoform X2 n=1 Tax=Uloborus diversus TaxID=327109 RepID=UPI002409964E|nr:MKRN2 opposite strand protein-like isoform X2 [Uloborus diversus]